MNEVYVNKMNRAKTSEASTGLDVFLSPGSVAVIGASERPGSWGSFIMGGLLSCSYSGKIYPVNPRADKIYGVPAYDNIRKIKEPVDLAVCTIPENLLEQTVKDCGHKGIKGITIITAGFGETSEQGRQRQASLARLARSFDMRLIGPNVSGTFNLHAGFNASPTSAQNLLSTPIAAICQGGYAFYDILSSGRAKGMGVGKFIHTGNECDLTVTDFLELFGQDPEVNAIVMYIEAIRDGQRFMEIARKVSQTKPVVIYKAGRTTESARAAKSHTGAMAGEWGIYKGLLRQVGSVVSPTMELLLPIAHALIERPPMQGNRVAIITMGGSWGVALVDSLVEAGLSVPEFSPKLQKRLQFLGMPERASIKNPVDYGASGKFLDVEFLISLGREILYSSEIDILILHGFGRPGMHSKDTPGEMKIFLEVEKQQIQQLHALQNEIGLPVLIGSHYNPWESQAIHDLSKMGIRVYDRLHEIGSLLAALHDYTLKATIYNYFGSKDQVYLEVLRREMHEIVKNVSSSVDRVALPRDKLTAFVKAKFRYMRQAINILNLDREGIEKILPNAEVIRNELFEREVNIIQSILKEGVEKGVFYLNDILLASRAIAHGLRGFELYWLVHESEEKIEYYLDELMAILFYGLTSEKREFKR